MKKVFFTKALFRKALSNMVLFTILVVMVIIIHLLFDQKPPVASICLDALISFLWVTVGYIDGWKDHQRNGISVMGEKLNSDKDKKISE